MNSCNQKVIWEIFIPRYLDEQTIFHIKNHRECQNKIEKETEAKIIICSKTIWFAEKEDSSYFSSDMFPIRIICDDNHVPHVLDIIQKHYDLSVVYAYEVSSNVLEYNGQK